MNRRGQFYLITAMIIVTLIASFVTITNYSKKTPDARIENIGSELKYEAGKVIDFAIANPSEGSIDEKLLDFTKQYSESSEADNFYFIFGDSSSIRVAGLQKRDGILSIQGVTDANPELTLTAGSYNSNLFSPNGNSVNLTISIFDNLKYEFKLTSGQGFYYIVSKEIEEENHVATNS